MTGEWSERLDAAVDALGPRLRALRRHLHMHPEPSGEEVQTTAFLRSALLECGLSPRIGPEARGLIVDSGVDGPRVLLRGDIDALRLEDAKTVDYRSRRSGVMHACGHDAHATIVVGALAALAELEREGLLPWPAAWRGVLQPAEETAVGAREMISAGALDGVAAAFALHVDPTRELGTVGVRQGPLTASCDWMEILIQGRGGHAARPHESIDPIAAAAQLISAIYAFIPRSVDSQDPVVVTIGRISGGYSANVIPERAVLEGTIRTLDVAVRERTRDRIRQLARGVAEASGATVEVRFGAGLAAVRNDALAAAVIREAAAKVVGPDGVAEIERPSMGGEDFSAYLETTPGCMFRLGVRSETVGGPPLHSPLFDLDERALAIGAKILARAAVLWSRPAGFEASQHERDSLPLEFGADLGDRARAGAR